MTQRMAVALALIVLALAVLLFASSYGDKPVMLIDAAASPCTLPNPCDTVDCNRKRPIRSDLA